MAWAIGTGSAVVFLGAVLLGELLGGARNPVLYAYGAVSALCAVQLALARDTNALWIGGLGGMVSVAAGYSTLVAALSHPDLWFFSTGLSLTFAVVVVFQRVWHYLVSTALVWLVIAGVAWPSFDSAFDYALGSLVVSGAVFVGSYTIFLLQRSRSAAYALEQKLHLLAHQDALTGLPNRRAFIDALEAGSASGPYLLMLDIDDFKVINDTLGHDIGDLALKTAGATIEQHAGEHNHGRIGGEEFALSCATDLAGARAIAQALVTAFGSLTVEGLRLTVSIGVTRVQPDEALSSMLRRADQALYAAKRAGKNQYQVL